MENGFKKLIHLISFIAVFFIGIVLLVNLRFGAKASTFINVLNNIANIIAYIVVIVNAFYFVRTKRSSLYTILFLLAIVLITVCYIIPWF